MSEWAVREQKQHLVDCKWPRAALVCSSHMRGASSSLPSMSAYAPAMHITSHTYMIKLWAICSSDFGYAVAYHCCFWTARHKHSSHPGRRAQSWPCHWLVHFVTCSQTIDKKIGSCNSKQLIRTLAAATATGGATTAAALAPASAIAATATPSMCITTQRLGHICWNAEIWHKQSKHASALHLG